MDYHVEQSVEGLSLESLVKQLRAENSELKQRNTIIEIEFGELQSVSEEYARQHELLETTRVTAELECPRAVESLRVRP